ncbi:MAG: hypothetical protein JW772_00630 [Candidatus Diapherotrites archaeon]|nr:hypothetical protein [Candidatus Diapherotrites archaeon]
MKVKELQPMKSIDSLEVEIVSKEEPRQFASAKGSGTVCNCAAKDDTGEVKITLWNEQCNQFEEGDKVKITEGWCNLYKGTVQVSTGRNGTIEKIE